MAKRGRRPVLDDGKKREIVAILTVGCSRQTAAQYVGCAVSTISRTAQRDPNFAEQLRHAEHQHEITYLKNIQQAAKKPQYWRAAAWVLERIFPNRYARRGPDVITVEQFTVTLTQLVDMIVEEVPARYRKQIIKRSHALTKSLNCSPARKATDDE